MSLLSGDFTTKNIKGFEKDLRTFCKKQKPMILKTKGKTDVLPDRFWTGIHVDKTKEIRELQKKLQIIRNKYADNKEKHFHYPPHITLAFPAEVDKLSTYKLPIKKFGFGGVTIVKKDSKNGKYKILKHINFG